jgi:hypothetical protein
MDRMKKLTDEIGKLIETEFSGHIRINFSQGSIGRIEKSEELNEAEDIAFSGDGKIRKK